MTDTLCYKLSNNSKVTYFIKSSSEYISECINVFHTNVCYVSHSASFQYLKQNDCVELRHIIQNFPAPEEESLLLTSFIDKLGSLDLVNVDKVEDFLALRIDWQRLQVVISKYARKYKNLGIRYILNFSD